MGDVLNQRYEAAEDLSRRWSHDIRKAVDAADAAVDYEAAIDYFWAHAADLLAPTISSTGIDRALEGAIRKALGRGDDPNS